MLINYKRRKPLVIHDFRPKGYDIVIEYKGVRYDNYCATMTDSAYHYNSYRRAKTFIFVVKYNGIEVNIPYVRTSQECFRMGSHISVKNLYDYLVDMTSRSLPYFIEHTISARIGIVHDYSAFRKIQWELVKDIGRAHQLMLKDPSATYLFLGELNNLPPRIWFASLCNYSLSDLF
jgi:hypothetical protein